MALAYLLDPCLQHQNRAGVNNVSGYFEVFEYDTDDRATVYTDFSGSLAQAHIGIDNNGRAVMIVDSSIAYRVEMHAPNGDLIYTQAPVWTMASGGGVGGLVKIVSTDGTISVDKTTVGAVTTYDLSATGDEEPSTWGSKVCTSSAVLGNNEWVAVAYASSEGSIQYNNGWTVTKKCTIDVAASLEMTTGDPAGLHNVDVKCEFFKNRTSVLVENGQVDPSKSVDRVSFEYKGAANKTDVVDAIISVRSAQALTVGLVGRVFYNEECDGVIGGNGGGGGDYVAGEGINITGDVISIDNSVVQHKLVAGDNISINPVTNVISASGGSDLPPSTPADEGKVLTVDEDGRPEWRSLGEDSSYAIANGTITFTPGQYYTNGNVTLSNIRSKNIEYAYNMDGWVLEKDHVYVITFNIILSTWYQESGNLIGGRVWLTGFPESDQVWKFGIDPSLSHDESIVGSAIICPRNTGEVYLCIRYDSNQLAHIPSAYVNKAEIVDVTARVSGGGGEQVQSDWEEDDPTDPAYIKHRPDLSQYVTESELAVDLSDYQKKLVAGTNITIDPVTNVISASGGSGEQVQSDWTEDDPSDPAYIKHRPDLSQYATVTDLSGKADKVDNATAGNLAGLDSTGNLTDSGIAATDVATTTDLSGKADKVDNATAGNLAGLDANGNLTDSGIAATDVATTSDLAGKQDTLVAGDNITINSTTNVISATDTNTHRPIQLEGSQILGDNIDPLNFVAGSNVTITNSNGTLTFSSSGTQVQSDWTENDPADPAYIKHRPDLSQYATVTDLSGKADKVDNATAGNLAGLDATGNLVDSGIAATDVATTSDLAGKQDTLTPGANIQIVNNVISSTDTDTHRVVQLEGSTILGSASTDPLNFVAGSNVSITNSNGSLTISASGGSGTQVQSDWTENDSSDPAYIKHRPTEKELVAGANITLVDAGNTVVVSAASQVQANWSEADTSSPSYIQSKPSIPTIGTVVV